MFDAEMFMFWLIASLTGLCAIATVITQNIVRSATWLLFTLAGTSSIFFLLGADFVGAIQLLIYVGGTMVLVVFGVMLTAQGPFVNMRTSGAEWAISIVAGLMLLGVLCFGLTSFQKLPTGEALAKANEAHSKQRKANDPKTSTHASTIGQALSGVGYGPIYKRMPPLLPTKDAKGNLVTLPGAPRETERIHYLLPFEIVSVHLLVVLIGAAYLARAKRRRGGKA
ncbi:MAG: NADH-quinone oxidoreductase subunit J [Gemmataceae bacterium]|nr:NADH-quinone oxidoreductase subunit J [Gemmataceae bacterium]